MRVGIDVTPLLRERTGIAVCTQFVVDLAVAAGHEVVGLASGWRGLRARDEGIRVPLRRSWLPSTLNPIFLDRLKWPTVETATGPIDLFIATNHELRPTRAARSVALVHDVGRLRHPEFYTPRQVMRARFKYRRLGRFADMVVVPTEAMAAEVVALGLADLGRIRVVPWFPRHLPDACAAGIPGVPDDRPLLLCVATLDRHKNIPLLVRAFEQAARDLPHDLVVAGGEGSGAEEVFAAARGNGASGRIHFLGHVDGSRLASLYGRADFAVCPSRYEGFGLTLLEAMAAGCPVIAADIPAHREVAGDAAQLVSPDDEGAFASALVNLGRDTCAREQLRDRGLRRIQRFSRAETRRRLGELITRA